MSKGLRNSVPFGWVSLARKNRTSTSPISDDIACFVTYNLKYDMFNLSWIINVHCYWIENREMRAQKILSHKNDSTVTSKLLKTLRNPIPCSNPKLEVYLIIKVRFLCANDRNKTFLPLIICYGLTFYVSHSLHYWILTRKGHLPAVLNEKASPKHCNRIYYR